MYVLAWRTVSALTRVLVWYLFPLSLRNSGNKHQNNPLVSAETVRHSSTYIILHSFTDIICRHAIVNHFTCWMLSVEQDRWFADGIFKSISFRYKFQWKLSNFITKGPTHNKPSLAQIMTWRRPGSNSAVYVFYWCIFSHSGSMI